jgi:hypothetical protein
VLHIVDAMAARFIDVPDYAVLGRYQTALEQAAWREMDAMLAANRDGREPQPRGIVLTDASIARAFAGYADDIDADLHAGVAGLAIGLVRSILMGYRS